MVHDLQQDVEQVRVGLFDFVQQQHAMRMLIDAIREQAALIVADIAGRRADQTRDRVALHVFGHVKPQQLDAHDVGERPRNFGLPTPVGPANR